MVNLFINTNGTIKTYVEDDDIIVAKKTEHDNHANYYILAYSGDFYNPQQMHTPGYNTRKQWKFRPVSKVAFDYYLGFLTKGHTYLLTHAQREGTR